MRLKQAMKLRAKTIVLRGINRTVWWLARRAQRTYFAALIDSSLTTEERTARLHRASLAARDAEHLSQQCRRAVEAHRFDIIVHNEGQTVGRQETRTD